jgi:hypothetical protein
MIFLTGGSCGLLLETGRLVVCDNLIFKELYKAEENKIFREEIIKQL